MRDKIAERRPPNFYVDLFTDVNMKGSEQFGRLWMTATEQAVTMFRESGYGEELEHRDKRLACAVAQTLYRVLSVARR